MIRLLQVFDRFELRQGDAPPGSLPPPSWKNGPGRERIEKVWPQSSITLFAKVRILYNDFKILCAAFDIHC